MSPSTECGVREAILTRFGAVRGQTERLCAPLEVEDFGVQSMPDVSPTKWHLAHTSWFFETFVLQPFDPGYRLFHPRFGYLFNSYYNQVGERVPRPERGLLSRPTVREVFAYRAWVEDGVTQLIQEASDDTWQQIQPRIVLGLHHEQQHQELLLTDVKHVFACNPLRPWYQERPQAPPATTLPLHWQPFPEGLFWLGHAGTGFAFDNELPRHRVFLEGFQLAGRLTTCGEYLRFLEDDGYHRPELWLADGWNTRCQRGWQAPLYWEEHDGQWWQMTLAGMQPLNPAEPVCHVSYYEADAFARWSGHRLPTEAEWELAAAAVPVTGNFVESGALHPLPGPSGSTSLAVGQLFGDVWEWTASPYTAYPGYRPADGALGEYNGKFMVNQMVLRGGSCVTSQDHVRPTYRNFFAPDARWQFSGIRLARNLE